MMHSMGDYVDGIFAVNLKLHFGFGMVGAGKKIGVGFYKGWS